jgi:hypothetical protein
MSEIFYHLSIQHRQIKSCIQILNIRRKQVPCAEATCAGNGYVFQNGLAPLMQQKQFRLRN